MCKKRSPAVTAKKTPGKKAPPSAKKSPHGHTPEAAAVALNLCRAAMLEHLYHIDDEKELLTPALSAENAKRAVPKLFEVAQSIGDKKVGMKVKTLVMIHYRAGALTLEYLLRTLYQVNCLMMRPVGVGAEAAKIAAENESNRRKFNATDNIDGKRHTVMIADSEEFGEGTSFMEVRRIIMVGLVPPPVPATPCPVEAVRLTRPSWAAMKQRFGRALRCCSHARLPAGLRNLRCDLYISGHMQEGYPPTLEVEQLLLLLRDMPLVETAMDYLAERSIDRPYYHEALYPKKSHWPFSGRKS